MTARKTGALCALVFTGSLATACADPLAPERPVLEKTAMAFCVERAAYDQRDDSHESQIHLVYVVPLGGKDDSLDLNGRIEASFESAQNWLASQTGGRKFRVDTCGGRLDISAFFSQRGEQEMGAFGSKASDSIYAELSRSGFNAENKRYMVYYGGGNRAGCGSAMYGKGVGAIYLKNCQVYSLATSAHSPPGFWEYATLHEILHSLGYLDSHAPNHNMSNFAHSTDSNKCLMSGVGWYLPLGLDPGEDDFFGDNVPPGVRNLKYDPFLMEADPLVPIGIHFFQIAPIVQRSFLGNDVVSP